MLQGSNVLIAAHTGSGKTLSYLIPVIHRLRQQEQQSDACALQAPRRPRVVVLVPNAELGLQTLVISRANSAEVFLVFAAERSSLL